MKDDEKELTYGETVKAQLPECDKIEWIKMEVPKWYFGDRANAIISNQKYTSDNTTHWDITKTLYDMMKIIHENSQDFKITWKLKQTN